MRTRFLVTALAIALGAGLFIAAPGGQASANYGGVHCMKYGETLSGVAAMYGTTAWAIARYNGLANPNYVRAGQCLYIPPPGWGGYHTGYYGGYKPPVYPSQPIYKPYPPKPMPYHGGYGKHGGYYCVRPGDTLSRIGAMYGVSAWSIAYANGLANPNYIRIGQCLRIP